MKYEYSLKGKTINVYVSDDESDKEVSVVMDNKSIDGFIIEDETEKYFIFKKNKIYLKDLIPVRTKPILETWEESLYKV